MLLDANRNLLKGILVKSAIWLVLLLGTPCVAHAQAAALTGQVASAEDGAMEGVVVSAKKDGASVRISVVSDAQGRFSFPRAKLDPGRYSLRIRATGYELDGPASVAVPAGKSASLDLKLRKVQDITPQMT